MASAPNNSSVFDVIDQAIVAASDFPEEFNLQKSRILTSIQAASETVVEPPKRRHIIRLKIRRPVAVDQQKLIKPPCAKPILDEKAKLEATKRKIHDRYEEIEKSKRQKRIQVLNFVPEQNFKLACSAKPQGKQSTLRRPLAKKLGAQSLLSRLVAC